MGPEAGQSYMQLNFPPFSFQVQMHLAQALRLESPARGRCQKFVPRRSERLTIVMTTQAGKDYGKLTYESPDRTSTANRALASTTRMAAGRPRPGGGLPVCLAVSTALPLTGPQEVLPQRLRYPRHMSGARNKAVRPAVQHSAPRALEVLPQRLRHLGSGPGATASACFAPLGRDPRSPMTARRAGNAFHTRISQPAAPSDDSDGGAGSAGPDQTSTFTSCT